MIQKKSIVSRGRLFGRGHDKSAILSTKRQVKSWGTQSVHSMKTNIAPENWWLGDYFSFGWGR